MERVYMAADHAGFTLKEQLKKRLATSGLKIADLTPVFEEGDDYPAAGFELAKRVVKNGERGIVVCGSGEGVAIAANRIKRARAIVGHSVAQVKKAREHNDANILCLGGRVMKTDNAIKLVRAFLNTRASAAARHKRRVKQLG